MCLFLFLGQLTEPLVVSGVITAPASGVPEQRVSLRGPPHAQSKPSHPEGVGGGGRAPGTGMQERRRSVIPGLCLRRI